MADNRKLWNEVSDKEEDKVFRRHESHVIKPFRYGKLGVIRLDDFAFVGWQNFRISFGGQEFRPIGFDTYGHPIISEENFNYYKAMKFLYERKGDALNVTIDYNPWTWSIKEAYYNSSGMIEKSLESLKSFKNMLINRKMAAFKKCPLNEFIVYGKYFLSKDGHVYEVQTFDLKDGVESKKVLHLDEVENLCVGTTVLHIPEEREVCAICGKKFDMNDIENFAVSETEEARKVHIGCYEEYREVLEHKLASEIIDAVYDNQPVSSIIYDENQKGEETTWYCFKTPQGEIRIHFKTKVISIKWLNNFKPFNMSIFENERVRKYDNPDCRVIHAWSRDDAIRYLQMAKKA